MEIPTVSGIWNQTISPDFSSTSNSGLHLQSEDWLCKDSSPSGMKWIMFKSVHLVMVKDIDVLNTIVRILEENGFKKQPNGDMYRPETGCQFDFETLSEYETVTDFQLDWPYS